MKPDSDQIISITTSTIIRTLMIIGVVALAYFLRDLIVVLLASVVIASAAEPFTRSLMRWRLPRLLAVVLIYVVAIFGISASLYFFIPPLFIELSNLASTLPSSFDSFNLFDPNLDPLSAITGGLVSSISLKEIITEIQRAIVSESGGLFTATGTLFGGAASFVLIIVLSFYLSVQEDGVGDFLRLVTPVSHEKYVTGLWARSREKIGQWMKGQLLLGLIIGILVYLGLSLLGVKYALVLAVLAAVMELIPFFGPVISAVPAVLLGFSDSLVLGLLVLGFYIVVQQIENHILVPLVLGKTIGLNPVVVIIALLVGAQLAGIPGMILSVPVSTVIVEIFEDMAREKRSRKVTS